MRTVLALSLILVACVTATPLERAKNRIEDCVRDQLFFSETCRSPIQYSCADVAEAYCEALDAGPGCREAYEEYRYQRNAHESVPNPNHVGWR